MTTSQVMNNLHNSVMDVLRWHYFKAEYARAWGDPSGGITDATLLDQLESLVNETNLQRLKREGSAWAEYQMFSSKPEVEWCDVSHYIYPGEYLEVEHG